MHGPNKITTTHPFENYTRINVTISKISENSLLQVLKNHFDLSRLNGLLTSEEIMGKLQEVYKKHFGDKKMLKIRFTQGQLQDIREEDEQWNIVYKEHYRAHRGAEENKQQLLRMFYFPKLTQKVRDLTANCKICHENKYERNPSTHSIQETPISHIDILFLENETFLTNSQNSLKSGQ